MTNRNPHWSLQVAIGDGPRDKGAQHRAIDVARQLRAVGKWPDCLITRIIIHHPRELHRRLQLSGPPEHDPQATCNVYPGVHALLQDRDYEVEPLPADFWQMHGLPDPTVENPAQSLCSHAHIECVPRDEIPAFLQEIARQAEAAWAAGSLIGVLTYPTVLMEGEVLRRCADCGIWWIEPDGQRLAA